MESVIEWLQNNRTLSGSGSEEGSDYGYGSGYYGYGIKRYIDEEKLYNNIEEKYKNAKGDARKAYNDVLDTICEIPSADVQEVRHGKWRSEIVKKTDWRGKEQSYYQPNSCSICHTGLRVRTNFCPNCGAKMDGKE